MKLYCDMTSRKEKISFNSRMVAGWIRARRFTVMLPLIRFKRRTRDGWFYEYRYCVCDCNGEWFPIDTYELCDNLGIASDKFSTLAEVLAANGYKVDNPIGGIVILPKEQEVGE